MSIVDSLTPQILLDNIEHLPTANETFAHLSHSTENIFLNIVWDYLHNIRYFATLQNDSVTPFFICFWKRKLFPQNGPKCETLASFCNIMSQTLNDQFARTGLSLNCWLDEFGLGTISNDNNVPFRALLNQHGIQAISDAASITPQDLQMWGFTKESPLSRLCMAIKIIQPIQ